MLSFIKAFTLSCGIITLYFTYRLASLLNGRSDLTSLLPSMFLAISTPLYRG